MEYEKLNELNDKVDRILFYLDNDEKTGKKGLSWQCTEMRKDLDGLLEREKIKLAVTGAIATVFGLIGSGIIFLIKHFMSSSS